MINEIPSVFNVAYDFGYRPVHVPGRHRLSFRMLELLVLLHLGSRGGKSSVSRLHILNSIIRVRTTAGQVVRWGDVPTLSDNVVYRVEPALVRALENALALRWIETGNGRTYAMTTDGRSKAIAALVDPEAFVELREVAPILKVKISEKFAKSFHMYGV